MEKEKIHRIDDVSTLFTDEEIETRKKEILEKQALQRKKDFAAKELRIQERKELQDKGWASSNIGKPTAEIIKEAFEAVKPKDIILEPETPKKNGRAEALAKARAVKAMKKAEREKILTTELEKALEAVEMLKAAKELAKEEEADIIEEIIKDGE